MMSEIDIKDALKYNPFEGDFGEPGDITLKDKIGIIRKPRACHLCDDVIEKGERVRIRTDISQGNIMSFVWCNKCCVAMAAYENGNEDLINQRYDIPNHK